MYKLRIDRFLTVTLFRHFSKRYKSSSTMFIPILMYHSISDQLETTHPYYHVNTSPVVFQDHMRYLYENNYSVINLGDIQDRLNRRGALKCAIITFDDGFRDFMTGAFPVLKKYGFCATIFLPTAYIQNKQTSFKNKECLTWDEIRFLSQEGFCFGSHTVNHPQLSHISIDEVREEIQQSKHHIENETGVGVDSFSYPYAFPLNLEFKKSLEDILKTSGYKNGVTTVIGTADKSHNNYFYPRLPVNSNDDHLFFKAKLDGAYNWLNKPQALIKYLKSIKGRQNV